MTPINATQVASATAIKFRAFLLNRDIYIKYLYPFLRLPNYKLMDWISEDKIIPEYVNRNLYSSDLLSRKYSTNNWKINWDIVSSNPYAIELLSANLDRINWDALSSNSGAIGLLSANLYRINWHNLSANPHAVELLSANIDKINWYLISSNPGAVSIIKTNIDKVDACGISENPDAIQLLQKYPQLISFYQLSSNPNGLDLVRVYIKSMGDVGKCWLNWRLLSANPGMIPLLKEYPDKICWSELSGNPSAGEILAAANPDILDWMWLSQNPGAIDILIKYPHRINYDTLCLNTHPLALQILQMHTWLIRWDMFSTNSAIFEIDYDATYNNAAQSIFHIFAS
jgi:hypothetical protein